MFKKISENIAEEIKKQFSEKKFIEVIKSIDEVGEERKFKVIASSACVDRYNEIVDPKGLDKKNFMNNPVILWGHSHYDFPIGKADKVYVKNENVIVEGRFAPAEANPEAEKVFQLYKQGFLKAVSIGFLPKAWEDFKDDEGYKRKFTKWELLELSFVPVPANPEALDIMKSIGDRLKVDFNKMFIFENKKDVDLKIENNVKELASVVRDLVQKIKDIEDKQNQEPKPQKKEKVDDKVKSKKTFVLDESLVKKLRKNVQVADKALEQINISFKEIINFEK